MLYKIWFKDVQGELHEEELETTETLEQLMAHAHMVKAEPVKKKVAKKEEVIKEEVAKPKKVK